MATSTCSGETFNVPPEWNDNERMRFLLSPFPPNVAVKYDDPKVKFWRALIMSSCKQLKRISFTEDQLVERFCWNTFRPRCLGPILEAMVRHGDIQKRSDWFGSNEGWMRWGVGLLSRPVVWVWGSTAPRASGEEYILQGAVKEAAEAIVFEHQRGVVYQNTDNVMLGAEFLSLCERVVTPECADVVARHMMKERKVAEKRLQGDIQVIKFIKNECGCVVTEMDLQIVLLKQAISKMAVCVKSLRDETYRLRTDALKKYREHDQSAVGVLRRAKSRSAMLQKREVALDNLNSILERIQAAETDGMILSAYKEGLDALKKIKLDEEAVAVVMDELQEAMRDHEDINSSLAQDVTGVCDEDDLLKELEALLSGDQAGVLSKDDSTLEETFASLDIGSSGERGGLATPLKGKVLTTPLKGKEAVATPLKGKAVATPLTAGGQASPLMEDQKGDKRKQKSTLQSPVLA